MYYDRPDAFDAAECDVLVALAQARGLEPATVWSGSGDAVDRRMRDARRAYIARGDETAWIFDRMDALFAAASERFGTPVAPMFEALQIVEYGPGAHFQTWHSDAGADLGQRRRISASVELSAAEDHEGGVLEIVPDLLGQPRSLPRGGARLFPSQALHRVTPVTRGLRHALVAWTGLP